MHRNVAIPDYRSLVTQTSGMDICQIGCKYILIIEIDLLYGWAVLERRPNHVNKRVVADIDFWQFLEPWHGRWYEYEIFIASCTDNIYDLENERWLLGDMIDHVGIYGSRVAEGLSAFNVDCGLSMWGKIMIPMYRLWLHCLYGLYGPHCPLSPERPLNLITHSLTPGWWVTIASGNGLVLSGSKPLPKPMVDNAWHSAISGFINFVWNSMFLITRTVQC